MTVSLKDVVAYTDGSCETQTGEGGWAFHLRMGNHSRQMSGHESGTTNNRMELTAAVRALETLTESCSVTLVTDSQYLKNAFTAKWLDNWQRNGWKTASRQPVKNRDLWERLLAEAARHELKWKWTRGHSGQPENELVDRLAQDARKQRRGVDQRVSPG